MPGESNPYAVSSAVTTTCIRAVPLQRLANVHAFGNGAKVAVRLARGDLRLYFQPLGCTSGCTSMFKASASEAYIPSDLHLLCALGETRTPNLLIRSQMLYPLSYERLCIKAYRLCIRTSPMFAWARTTAAIAAIAAASFASAPSSAPAAPRLAAQPALPLERAIVRIHETGRVHRVWLSLDYPSARAQALTVANAPDDSPLHGLDGLVVAVKDNIDTNWLPTTAGARVLRNRRPGRNATAVDRVLAAGGVIPGKTNLDTFARGVRTVSEIGGQTRNAIDPSRSPGGSSGGTAVAIALEQSDLGIGTDTCGSLRYPAAYNGIYGLRPTPGLVSRSGIIPLSATHDVVGPMARTPQNLARLLDVIAGPDERDPLTLSAPQQPGSYADVTFDATASWTRLRIGVLRDRGPFAKAPDGRSSLTLLSEAGFLLVEVNLPSLGLPNVINEEFAVLRPKILSGTLSESSWIGGMAIHQRAYQSKLAQMKADANRLLSFLDANQLDAIVYPTTPFPAASIGRPQPSANCSLSASTGLPAMALPHPTPPIPGVDVLARPFAERILFEVAVRYSKATSR